MMELANNDRDGTIVVSCIMFNTVHTPTMVIILCQTITMAIILLLAIDR